MGTNTEMRGWIRLPCVPEISKDTGNWGSWLLAMFAGISVLWLAICTFLFLPWVCFSCTLIREGVLLDRKGLARIRENNFFLLRVWSNAEEVGSSVFVSLDIISCAWIYVNPSAVGNEGAPSSMLPQSPSPAFSAAARVFTEPPSLLIRFLTLEDGKSQWGLKTEGPFLTEETRGSLWSSLDGWKLISRSSIPWDPAFHKDCCQVRVPLGLSPQKSSLGASAKNSLFTSFLDMGNGPAEALSIFPLECFCLFY